MSVHFYVPHEDYPWFCDVCGYAEHERLKHPPRDSGIEARRVTTPKSGVIEDESPGSAEERKSPSGIAQPPPAEIPMNLGARG